MAELVVNQRKINSEKDALLKQCKKLVKIVNDCDSIRSGLYGSQFDDVRGVITGIKERISVYADNMGTMAANLDKAMSLYEHAEKNLLETTENSNKNLKHVLEEIASRIKKAIEDFLDWIKKEEPVVVASEISSIVFDDDGAYGGNQGSAYKINNKARKQEFYDLIRKNNPDEKLTDKQLDKFLRKMNSEGCGYVALVNTVFVQYQGREQEFENTFGYSMYGPDGDLNYDMLLVDLYSTCDTKHKMDDYDPSVDGSEKKYSYWDDTTGGGTSQYDREDYLEEFMKAHSVEVDVKTNQSIKPSNVMEKLNNGESVIIAYRYGNIYDESGKAHYINGGHAMSITGVTEDGRYIVSSWGKKYYLDPNEVVNNNTSMTYSTVVYE